MYNFLPCFFVFFRLGFLTALGLQASVRIRLSEDLIAEGVCQTFRWCDFSIDVSVKVFCWHPKHIGAHGEHRWPLCLKRSHQISPCIAGHRLASPLTSQTPPLIVPIDQRRCFSIRTMPHPLDRTTAPPPASNVVMLQMNFSFLTVRRKIWPKPFFILCVT